MKRTHKDRALIARAVMFVVSAACGIAAGNLLGRVLALEAAEHDLDQYAKLMVVHEDASSVEARNLLSTLKESPYASCSDAEIAYFRELVFRSEYLKDAGRILGGKIACSATAGRPMRSILDFKASTQKDGTIAYSNLLPLKDAHLKRPGLQLGTAYVVFGSELPTTLGTMPMHLIVTMKDAEARRSGSPVDSAAEGKEPDLTMAGMRRVGQMLYATQCSTVYTTCMTASATTAEALNGERMTIAGSIVLGCGAGALLGIVFSMMYRRSLNLEQQLRRAVARNGIQVVYQPIVNLATGRIVGAEALARWTNEEGTAVSPDVFIKIAEDNGFVAEITRMVVNRTLQDFAKTLIHCPGFRVSINVAAADLLDRRFLPMLDEAVKRARVSPKSVVIEITESSAADSIQSMETIRTLRHMGHSVHIDDFGTGYSNLDKLLYLWADTIKIDKAFTRVIGTDSITAAILPQILGMARSLNLDVVVEGVETLGQASYFSPTERHRIFAQGWLFGHPLPAEEFHAQLANDRRIGPRAADLADARSGGSIPIGLPDPALLASRRG
ncbi:MAG: EAL domain-containing protein [Terracidiphilus sp.]